MTKRVAKQPVLPRRSFMSGNELLDIRHNVLNVTQEALAELVENPSTGDPITTATISRWENESLSVPLWAAKRLRELAERTKQRPRPATEDATVPVAAHKPEEKKMGFQE